VPTVRGEIFDRNGVPLVSNVNKYDIVIDGSKMPRRWAHVAIIIDLVEKIGLHGGATEPDTFPVIMIADFLQHGPGDKQAGKELA
jgi:cell division protein FtsI/penicillin-binding protein 2